MTALMPGLQAPHLVDTLAGVERVLGLAVGVACGGCGSSVERGRCTYVGCRVLNRFEYTVRYVTLLHLSDMIPFAFTIKNLLRHFA